MVIKRNLYLNRLIRKKHNGLIKVITGMRRCGKSYLLFKLFKAHLLEEGIDKEHIIEMAFDSDRGFQYTNRAFHTKLEKAGMTQSMSRVAHCIDNGPMEGFWAF